MKRLHPFRSGLTPLCALAFAILLPTAAGAISLDFSNEPGSYIQFQRDGTLVFADEVDGGFDDIRITASDGTGAAVELTGDIDGVFTIGAISTFDMAEVAALTGTGTLSIYDGLGAVLTGEVSFGSIMTTFNFGAFNVLSSVNLSNLAYGGTNADLLALANGTGGTAQASFTGPIGSSLSSLIAGGYSVGNYSGAIGASAPVPEPSAALSFAIGAIVVSGACRRRK